MCIPGTSTINTTNGPVEGKRFTMFKVRGHIVEVFLGIPYAAPPVGVLRFKRPQEHANWREVLRAFKEPPSCPQKSSDFLIDWQATNTSEDCLYLNIFTPRPIKDIGKRLRPVLLWLHGGHFESGSSVQDVYDGRVLAAASDLMVVSLNYRLGALGFLNIGSNDSDQNVGLWDQHKALKWVSLFLCVFFFVLVCVFPRFCVCY